MKRWLSKPIRLQQWHIVLSKLVIHISALGYLGGLFYLAIQDQLGADPVEALLHETGTWAINILILTLFISPLAKRLPMPDLIRYRRLVGVYSFFYALAHFLVYIAFELQFDWMLIAAELIDRPYIVVGFSALILLVIMAATSFKHLQRQLGKKWQRIHNTVYLCAGLALLHFTWSLKTSFEEPLIYWAVFVLLMYWRKDQWQRVSRKWFATRKPVQS